MTHPHLEGLIPEVPPLPKNPDSADCARRVGYAEAVDEMRRRVAALAALPGGGVDGEQALTAVYDDFCAKDNGDVPLERYPQGAVDALARAGWAVVPCALPFAVLGDAASAGVFETGNPKHGWDYLIARTRIGPALPTPNPHEADRNG